MRYVQVLMLVFGLTTMAPGTALMPGGTAAAPDGGPPASGDWTVNDTRSFSGTTFAVDGNLTVLPGGNLTLSGVTLHMTGVQPGARIEVQPGGALVVQGGSTLDGFSGSAGVQNYRFQVRPGATLRVLDSSVNDVGLGGVPPPGQGLFIASDDVIIRNATFDACFSCIVVGGAAPVLSGVKLSGASTGLWVMGTGNGTMRATGVTTPGTGTGVRAESGSLLYMAGSTVSGKGPGLVLDSGSSARLDDSAVEGTLSVLGASTLDLVNTTFNDSRLESQGRISVFRWLDAGAVWQNGAPVSGAPVTLSGENGQFPASGTTGPDGRVVLAALDYVISYGERLDRAGHTVAVSKGAANGSQFTEVHAGMSVTVHLTDATPPAVAILSPAGGTVFNSPLVHIEGAAFDGDSGLLVVEVSGDGGTTWLDATTAWDTWSVNFSLADSTYDLAARATNRAGTTSTRTLAGITVDTRLVADWTSPAEGRLYNLTNIMVSGYAEAGSSIAIDEPGAHITGILAAGGTFSVPVAFTEGSHNLTLTVTDRAGNNASWTRHFTVDTTPPEVVLFNPKEYTVTKSTLIRVDASAEPGTFVELAISGVDPGSRAAVCCYQKIEWNASARKSGAIVAADFRVVADGTYALVLRATDAAGNANQTSALVVVDTAPPSLYIIYPPPGLVTSRATVPFIIGNDAPALKVSVDFFLKLNVTATRSSDYFLRLNDSIVSRTAPDQWTNGTATRHVDMFLAVEHPGAAFNASFFDIFPEMTSVSVSVTATDEAGNTAVAATRFEHDATPPVISVASPPDGALFRTNSIVVSGTSDASDLRFAINEPGVPNRTIAVGTISCSGCVSDFATTLTLPEGRTSITLVATDSTGLVSQVTVRVTVDTTPPTVSLTGVAGDGAVLSGTGSTFSMNGRTEPGATLAVNGKAVPVASDGTFSLSIPLKDGANPVLLSATDPAGNAKSVSFTVDRHTEAVSGTGTIPIVGGVLAGAVGGAAAGFIAGRWRPGRPVYGNRTAGPRDAASGQASGIRESPSKASTGRTAIRESPTRASAGEIAIDEPGAQVAGRKGWDGTIKGRAEPAAREAGSGMATGKRQHRPLTVTDEDGDTGSDARMAINEKGLPGKKKPATQRLAGDGAGPPDADSDSDGLSGNKVSTIAQTAGSSPVVFRESPSKASLGQTQKRESPTLPGRDQATGQAPQEHFEKGDQPTEDQTRAYNQNSARSNKTASLAPDSSGGPDAGTGGAGGDGRIKEIVTDKKKEYVGHVTPLK